MKAFATILATLLLGAAGAQAPAPYVQKRVSPQAYAQTPAFLRAALERRHCQLPETQHWDHTPLNVVQGHFGDAQQTDWAALCLAADGSTRALVFWGKAAPCPAEIRHGWALHDRYPPGQAGTLYLLKASPKHILGYRKAFGDPHTNPVLHDGVEVGVEQASLIYYCYGGHWLELQGSD